jgi:hypothetical protein
MSYSTEFKPTPNSSWPANVQANYKQEYKNEYTKLQGEALKCDLKAAMYSITTVAVTALAITLVASAGSVFTLSAGGIALIVVGCISLGTVGITAAVVYGIWTSSERAAYENSIKVLNDTLKPKYELKLA